MLSTCLVALSVVLETTPHFLEKYVKEVEWGKKKPDLNSDDVTKRLHYLEVNTALLIFTVYSTLFDETLLLLRKRNSRMVIIFKFGSCTLRMLVREAG